MKIKIVMGLMLVLSMTTLGFQKGVKADMRKDGKLVVITLSAEERIKLFKQYKVKKGDTLTKLSNKFDVKIREMVKDNNIKNPDLIIVNQKLKIEDKELERELEKESDE